MWCLVVAEGRKTFSCPLVSVRDGLYSFGKVTGPAVVRYLLVFDGYEVVAGTPTCMHVKAGESLCPEFTLS